MVGKDVKINGFSFHILDCDDVTRKWYAEFMGTTEAGRTLALGDTSRMYQNYPKSLNQP